MYNRLLIVLCWGSKKCHATYDVEIKHHKVISNYTKGVESKTRQSSYKIKRWQIKNLFRSALRDIFLVRRENFEVHWHSRLVMYDAESKLAGFIFFTHSHLKTRKKYDTLNWTRKGVPSSYLPFLLLEDTLSLFFLPFLKSDTIH